MTRLTLDLLDKWMHAWRAHGIPLEDAWRDGLDADAFARLEAQFEITLPPDLRVWWQWHDGTNEPWGPERRARPFVAGPVQMWPANEAVDVSLTEQHRERAHRDLIGFRHDWYYAGGWIAIGRTPSGNRLCASLEPSDDGSSEIRVFDPQDVPPYAYPRLKFSTLVTWWIEAINDGVHIWDSTRKILGPGDFTRVPRERLFMLS